jgi:hypothetical protein
MAHASRLTRRQRPTGVAAPFLAILVVAVAGVLSGCMSLPTRQELSALPAPHTELAGRRAVTDGRARFRDIFCAVLEREQAGDAQQRPCSEWLWNLGDDPVVEHRPLPLPDLAPQVYLVTGAFSECLGDEARPFNNATTRLRAAGYRIATIVVGGRSGSEHNAQQIAERLANPLPGEEGPVVLIGYSKGANDILEFLVRYPGLAARVETMVSVAGAVGGTPAADQAVGVYDLLFNRIPSSRCAPGDGKVIDSLGQQVRQSWLEQNALPGHVRFFSLATFTTRERVAATLVPVWKILLAHDLRNDGQLLARDMLVPGSTLLGYADADHWSVAIDVEEVHPVLGARTDAVPFPRAALLEAILLQVGESRARVPGPEDSEALRY